MGEEMPKTRTRKKKKSSFSLGQGLMIVALGLLVWLILKSFGLVDPPEDFTTYILEAILTVMITAWITESRDWRKRSMNQGERIAKIEGLLENLSKKT